MMKINEEINITKEFRPCRINIIKILNNLTDIIFPGFNSCEENKCINNEFIGLVNEEIKKAFLVAKRNVNTEEIVEKFINDIPNIISLLKKDLIACYQGDPAAFDINEIIFAYPGIRAIAIHRIAHSFYKLNVPYIPRIMSEYAHSKTGIDIHPGAEIGEYFFIDHGTGVVIGETTIIGNNVRIYQGVTLGALSLGRGNKLKGTKRHPTIGNNVIIYAGASILGGETIIGDNVTIGSNSYILESVQDNTIVRLKSMDLEFKSKNS